MALKGKNDEEKIWNFFSEKGLSDYACSGILGNLYAESGLKPNNLQNTYEKKLGFTDVTYTKAVDDGSYLNFIKDCAGYGICQWTFWSRKKALYNFAKSKNVSIGNLEMQLEFLYKELTKDFKSVFNKLKTATSVSQASNIILLEFEKPANQSVSVQNKRASYSQKYYDKYAKKKDEGNSNVIAISPIVPVFKMRTTKPEAGNKYYITQANGGWSLAVQGSPKDKDCDVLSNCVGYAYGRFNEIGKYGYCKYLSPVNAERFIECKNPELKVGQTPKLGACMVWQKGNTLKGADGAGHVAIVEKVISDTEIYTSESGWGSVKPFWNQIRKKGSDGRWGMNSTYKFLGFIYNPAVSDSIKAESNINVVEPVVKPTIKIESAKSFLKSLSGTYKTIARLNMRTGAGTNKNILTVIPKGDKVTCYGYYSIVNGIKWYYVVYKNNQGVEYTGFVSSEYVKK